MKFDGCNAEIQLLVAYYTLTSNFIELPQFVELQICIADWQSTLILPLQQLNIAGIQAKCPLLLFRRGKSRADCNDAITSALLSGLKNGTILRGYYLDRPGAITFPDGHVCFLRGNELIGRCDRPYFISPEISDVKLLGNEHADSLSQLLPLLLQAPPQALLVLAFVILSSIRSILIGSGLDLQAVLYIVGKQGRGKTTLAQRISGIYERAGKPVGVVQAGATHAAVNAMMSTLRDQSVIIDDLCLSASRDTARKRVDLASRLIRQGTGTIPICKQVGHNTVELPCEVNLIFTAEFALENLSDLTRCIIVPVQEFLDIPNGLAPALIGTGVRFYSQWLCDHLDEETTRFHQEINKKEDFNMDIRVANNYTLLGAAMKSFICSLCDLGFSSGLENAVLKKMNAAISEAVLQHQAMIDTVKSHIPVGNLSFCILEGFKHDAFDLTDKVKKLYKHDGIVWNDDLCLRRDALISFVHQQSGYQDWSANKITRALKDLNALVLQEDGVSTVHLADGAPRVYRIRVSVLKDTAEEY